MLFRSYEEAEAAYRRAIELDPKFDHPRLNLAGRLVKSDPSAAIELLKRAPGLVEWEPFVRQNILKPIIQLGRAELCVKFLEETGLSQKWMPTYEACLATVEGSKRRLNRLVPEVREPTMKIYRDLLTPSK